MNTFNSFTFQNGRDSYTNADLKGSTYYLGVDKNTINNSNPTIGVYDEYVQNSGATSGSRMNASAGKIRGAAVYVNTTNLKNVNLHLAGSNGNVGDGNFSGVIGIHTVNNVNLENIKATLYGQADFVSIETWHNGTVNFVGTDNTVNVKGEKNTLFYIYPSIYEAATASTKTGGTDYSTWNVAHQRGGFIGSIDANIATNNNTVYSIMGIQGAFNIDSRGKYKLIGSGNIVYSGLGYSPNYGKIQGHGGVGYDSAAKTYAKYANVGFTPAIQLTKAPESYGDNNIIMFFEKHTSPTADVWPANTTNYTADISSWGKSTVGIYQGEISAKAIIGEYTNVDSSGNGTDFAQTDGNVSGGYNDYVENNIGIYSRSGQRKGIIPSTNLGATDAVTTNSNPGYNGGAGNEKANFDANDPIHSLEVNNIDIKFGKKSLSGIMVVAENGTLIDVASTHNSHVSGDAALAGTAIQNTAIKDYSSTVTTGTISDNDTTNKVGTGTIVAYADGKTVGYVAGKMSQINLGQDVETASRYKAITTVNGTKEYYPVAYVAKNNGVITVAGDTTAKGYKQIIGYAENGGEVKLGWVSHNDDSTLEVQATGGKGKITAMSLGFIEDEKR